jgi:predicted GNAT family N-acyltransferase
MAYFTSLLQPLHIKEHFDCGKEMLNRYLHQQAKQDVNRHLAACFVLSGSDNVVTGYYTLSNANVPRDGLPESIIKKLPSSYRNLPVTLLGRLALDKSLFGKGMGSLLLIDALRRSYNASNESVGSMAVVVDPLDQEAEAFYAKFGFIMLPDSGKMFLPMPTISKLFS